MSRGALPLGGAAIALAMTLAMMGPLVTVGIWAFAEQWRYPNLLPTDWGLRLWAQTLSRESVTGPILTSLALASITTSIAALICWPAAYAFARLRFPGRRILFFAFLAAQAFPKFPLYVAIAVLFLQLGLVGTFWGVVMVQLMSALLFMIWIPTAAFRAMPATLEEAAFDLGASRLRVFLEVTLPQALPALAASYILGFVAVLFEVEAGLLIGAPTITTMPMQLLVLSTQIVVQQAAVLCVLIWAPCLLLLVLSRRLISAKGIAQGFGA
jgi:putative spermidine/putrescine transport system permease protein